MGNMVLCHLVGHYEHPHSPQAVLVVPVCSMDDRAMDSWAHTSTWGLRHCSSNLLLCGSCVCTQYHHQSPRTGPGRGQILEEGGRL